MKIYCLRTDMIMLDVRMESEAHASISYWKDRCREVPDELIEQYNKTMQELERVSDAIEQAYEQETLRVPIDYRRK